MPPEIRETALAALKADLQTLDSKINLLNEKIRTIERNEEVIGHTIVALNDKVKRVESTLASGGGAGASAETVEELRAAIADLRKNAVTRQELQEVRYLLDTINPLQFATLEQVRELLREELSKHGKA